jgi:serine/threonine protein kinase/ABC-type Fe3+ transport system substrate-binding protein
MSDPNTPASDPLVGTVLEGVYRIDRLVAKGGMGSVYEAFHLRLDKRIAVKTMAPELATNAEAVMRFHREAMITGGLGHPNIVQVLDHSVTPNGEQFLAMEYLEGEDLDQRLRRVGRLPLVAIVAIVKQVAAALAAAHAKGIVHRDLKPANVWLLQVTDGPEFVKVLDFGISKVLSSTTKLTKAAMVMGTPDYMSPEQALGKLDDIDHRSDQWALACITWECLAGRAPFRGDTVPSLLYQIVHEAPQPLGSIVPDLPPGIELVLRRALSKDRDDRFRSVTDFARALEDALGGRDSAVTPPPRIVSPTVRLSPSEDGARTPPTQRLPTTFSHSSGESLAFSPPPSRTRARWPWLVGAALLLSAGGLFYSLRQGRPPAIPAAPLVAAGVAALDARPAPPVSIQIVYSTEEKAWIEAVTAEFAKSHARTRVELTDVRSIEAAAAILAETLKPAIWIPADTMVLTMLESEWRAKRHTDLFARHGDDKPQPLVLTPLVFAVWEDRAAGLVKAAQGAITWKVLHKAIASPKGWAAIGGSPTWGDLKLGMTDPSQSNSGLQALYLMMLEATGKRRLLADDLSKPSAREFTRGVMKGARKLGSSSNDIVTDMIRFGPSRYDVGVIYESSALSEFDNADGRGAILKVYYPNPTVWSDHPAALLTADWVDEPQRQAAREYLRYLRSEAAQKKALDYGFRPADTSVKIATGDRENPFARHAARGVTVQIPSAVEAPDGTVVRKLLQLGEELVRD